MNKGLSVCVDPEGRFPLGPIAVGRRWRQGEEGRG
jgi:hypothetical protein